MTIGPGDEVHELFGHNALLRITRGPDGKVADERLYNWGVFDFQQKNFIWNFIQGRMIYRMDSFGGPGGAGGAIEMYRERQRYVRLRQIQLSPAQAKRLSDFCTENDTDANRNYRYDYYRDNCSTRVRDAIDFAIGGQLHTQLQGPASTTTGSGEALQRVTYRWHTDRLTPPLPWLYFSLHYVLGHPVDRPISEWEECFLPERLEHHLDGLTLKWEDGTEHAVLGGKLELIADTRVERAEPPRWWWVFLTIGAGWGGVAGGLGLLARRGRWARHLAGGVVALWALVCVVSGGVSTWSWLFTDHVVARNNENWLQLSPLSLGVLVAGVAMIFRGRSGRWGCYAAWIVLALSAGGWIIKLLPGMIQPNWSLLLLALPVHAGVLVAVRGSCLDKGVSP